MRLGAPDTSRLALQHHPPGDCRAVVLRWVQREGNMRLGAPDTSRLALQHHPPGDCLAVILRCKGRVLKKKTERGGVPLRELSAS